jgi:hypothetical protein
MATGDLHNPQLLEADNYDKLATARPRAGPAERTAVKAGTNRADLAHSQCRVVALHPRRPATTHARPLSIAAAPNECGTAYKRAIFQRLLDAWVFATRRLTDYPRRKCELIMLTTTTIKGGTGNGHQRN